MVSFAFLTLIEERNTHWCHGKLHHALKKYHAMQKVSYLCTIRNSSLLNHCMHKYLRNLKMVNLIFMDIPYKSLP
jgi:hypothetical protein